MTDEFTRRRWDRAEKPGDVKPIDAVRNMLYRMENEPGFNPNHVMIIYSNKENEDGATGYCQAGDLTYHGQQGLLTRTLYLMNTYED